MVSSNNNNKKNNNHKNNNNKKKKKRPYRRWSLRQKREILDELEQAKKSGVRGAAQQVLDYYGLDTSYIVAWKRELARAEKIKKGGED